MSFKLVPIGFYFVMSDLDDFIREHNLMPEKNRKSVLAPYADEILKMKEMGFTEKIILQFLKEKKGISVSQQTLNWFIRSRSEKPAVPAAPVQSISVEKPERTKQEKQEAPPSNTAAGKARTFDWQKQPTREELFGTSQNEQDK